MPNPYFTFKQFTVYHDRCAMKVGTDGVLLGSWVNVENAEKILDVGTGTGLIALMAAQRSHAIVHGVEINEHAWLQAQENVNASPWKERIHVYHDSFQNFAGNTSERYDAIISNPPYFRQSLKSPDRSRTTARHDDKLDYESLFYFSAKILKTQGKLFLIFPSGEFDRICNLAYLNGFFPSQACMIRPEEGKEFSRCMCEFSKENPGSCEEMGLSIRNTDHQFTEAYKALTADFYLKLS